MMYRVTRDSNYRFIFNEVLFGCGNPKTFLYLIHFKHKKGVLLLNMYLKKKKMNS